MAPVLIINSKFVKIYLAGLLEISDNIYTFAPL
jgi:hypothetical protein